MHTDGPQRIMVLRISAFLRSIESKQRREECSFRSIREIYRSFHNKSAVIDDIYLICPYYLEITAVFEGIFVDTHCKVLLNHILSHSPKRKVDQMGFFNGEVDF